MAILRTITVTVSTSDSVSLLRSGSTDGYGGEHLATRLSVTVPSTWDSYNAYVTWTAFDGWEDESPVYLIVNPSALSFNYDLPFNAMKAGMLNCSITAKKTTGGSTQVVHTANFALNISKSVDGTTSQVTTFHDAIDNHEKRIDTLELNSGLSPSLTAASLPIADVGGYYPVHNVESALQTVGAHIANHVSPTGSGDDTAYLAAILAAYPVVILEPGTYYIDAVTKLQIPSNRTLIFQPEAIFQCITNNESSYRIVEISSASNVVLMNPYILGDRSSHTGGTGESGHGIVVTGTSQNVHIYNPIVKNCWGDGIDIISAQDLWICDAICDNNRRNGITLTSGIGVHLVRPRCSNTNGTAPQAGIDIEPNSTSDDLQNVFITNPVTNSNYGAGISLELKNMAGGANSISVSITGHSDDGSNTGFVALNARSGATGSVRYSGKCENTVHNGIQIQEWANAGTPSLLVESPIVINCNTSSSASPVYGSGISIIRLSASAEATLLGNVYITNPTVVDTRSPMVTRRAIYARDEKDVDFTDLHITNPLHLDALVLGDSVDIDANGVSITDDFDCTVFDIANTSPTISHRFVSKIINPSVSGSEKIVTLSSVKMIGTKTMFQNQSSFGIKIVPPGTMNILPLSSSVGKYINAANVGSSITLRRISATSFYVENMVGTWTVQP